MLKIVNNTDIEQRFMVSDPANSEVGRHLRVDETIAAGASYSLDPVDALLGEEIYPFWLQGLQEEGYAGRDEDRLRRPVLINYAMTGTR